MYYDGFSVRVIGGKELDGYVRMSHGQEYSLAIGNKNSLRCNAQISIDGEVIDTWRINSHETITVEGPADKKGRFTFYRLDSKEGNKAELNSVSKDSLGLIEIKFTPEKKREIFRGINSYRRLYSKDFSSARGTDDYDSAILFSKSELNDTQEFKGMDFVDDIKPANLSPGGTGLSGNFEQQYKIASKMDLDESKSTYITLRLVHSEEEEVRPLTRRGNRVPPPIQ